MSYNQFDRFACPTCGLTETTPITTSRPHAVRCNTCGLGCELTVSDDPFGAYAPDNYDKKRDNEATKSSWRRFHHDCAVAHERLKQLQPIVGYPDKERAHQFTWIDVGASTGAFAVVARREGWQTGVVELDAEAVRRTEQLFGISGVTYNRFITDPPISRVVSLFDVLEHQIDFPITIMTAEKVIMQGGYLVVEVPDFATADDFEHWKHRRITSEFVEHQWHFTEGALVAAITKYAPTLTHVRTSAPVFGKLQMVWQRTDDATLGDVVERVIKLPAHEQHNFLSVMRQQNVELYEKIVSRINQFHQQNKDNRQENTCPPSRDVTS